MDERVYRVNQSTITIRFGDITTSTAEVVVSSDDGSLSHGGGVSAAIYRAAGGRVMDREYRKLQPVRAGQVVVTSAGNLPGKYILHAITLDAEMRGWPQGTIVRQLTHRIMEIVLALGCTHIALPSIGTGVARIPTEDVAAEMGAILVRTLLASAVEYRVELYLYPEPRGGKTEEQRLQVFEERIQEGLGLLAHEESNALSLNPPAQVARIESRQEQVYAMLRHLDLRRDHLESMLLETPLVDQSGGPGLSELQSQLAALRDLRSAYAQEAGIARPLPRPRPKSVFVSSTVNDLQPHRQAIREVLNKLGLEFIGMEEFQPSGTPPADYIRDRVEEAEVYLGIVGMRYGTIDTVSGFSMTELEYRQAVASNKERYIFPMDEDAPISFSMVEHDPDGLAKLLAFRNRVQRANVVKFFKTVDDFAYKAEQVLRVHLKGPTVSTRTGPVT